MEKYKEEAATANTASLAYKQKLEDMKAAQQMLIDTADAKGFQEGTIEATQSYKAQVEQLQNKACGVGYLFGLKATGIPETSDLYKALPKTKEVFGRFPSHSCDSRAQGFY